MKNKRKLGILLASTMLINLVAFPVSAGASTEANNIANAQAGDIAPLDAKAPELKAQTVLDIGKGKISIGEGSVTGFAPDGTPATVNPNGYEITGSTTTNNITIHDAVPITINGLNVDYNVAMEQACIAMTDGGEITVLGTNTINRSTIISNDRIDGPLIWAMASNVNSTLHIRGTGTLNMTDTELFSPLIAVVKSNTWVSNSNLVISGDVTINMLKKDTNVLYMIGHGFIYANNSGDTTTVITDNVKINASIDGLWEPGGGAFDEASMMNIIIGGIRAQGGDGRSKNSITISGKAEITAIGGYCKYSTQLLGFSGEEIDTNITIEEGTNVKLDNRAQVVFAENPYLLMQGMGFPPSGRLPIKNSNPDRTTDIRISPLANVEAPARENYYKALDGTTPVYKATVSGLASNAKAVVSHGGKTVPLNTHADGTMNFYLPVGEQSVEINGILYKGIVDDSGNTKLEMVDLGPKLSVLEVKSELIQQDGTKVDQFKPLIQDPSEVLGFNPNTKEYAMYLRSIDTNDINVYVRHNDAQPLNIKIGALPAQDVDTFEEYTVPITLAGDATQEIPIVVRKGNKTTTYTIKVYKSQKAENDPHMFAELEINPVKKVLELGVYAMNVDVNSFEMTIKIDELLANENKAFSAFVDNKGVPFSNLNTNLAGNLENYFNLDSRFEISDMRSDGKFINFTVDIKNGNDIIKLGATPEKILSINVQRNPDYKGNVIKEIDTLKMQQVIITESIYGNSLSSKFYGDINDTYNPDETSLVDEKTLAYLVFNGQFDVIRMYVSYDANKEDRATFEIIDVATPGERPIVTSGKLVNREIIVPIIQSTYRLRVLAGGYLLVESEDIVYSGEPSKDGIIMTPVRLLEGNLDNNTVINTEDRTQLLKVLNRKVVIEGSGYVTITTALGDEDIYADYNNDNKINSLDLGRLVQNMGKQYGIITS